MIYQFNSLQPIYHHPLTHADSAKFLTPLGPTYVCDYSNVDTDSLKHVYEPDEDSYLLIDALHVDLHTASRTESIVEVGTGSGVVLTSYCKLLMAAGRTLGKVTGIDLNQEALKVTEAVLKQNQISGFWLKQSDLFAEISDKFGVIIFNPPYVVTPPEELQMAQEKKGIEASWAGGDHGIEVIVKFLPQALERLEPDGCIYILLISDNTPFLAHLDTFPQLKWSVIVKK